MEGVNCLLSLLTEITNLLAKRVEKVTEVEVTKLQKDYRKAVDYAEHALLIAERYSLAFTEKDRKRFNYLLKRYRRYN